MHCNHATDSILREAWDRQTNGSYDVSSGGGKRPAVAATGANPRGIPLAPFVDRVEDYVSTREDVEPTLRSFQEMIS